MTQVIDLSKPTNSSDVWVDVKIGHAQFGRYTVRLYDSTGTQVLQDVGGNNIDEIEDTFNLSSPASGFTNNLIGWTVTIATPANPNGEQYSLEIVIREGETLLHQEPIIYSGPLDGAKILMGFARFKQESG